MTTGDMTHDPPGDTPLTPAAGAPLSNAGGAGAGGDRSSGTLVSGRMDRGGPPGMPVPEPEYELLEDWLADYFLPMFRRPLGGEYRWCRQWWRHGEAISRLNALWYAWEVLRTQPGTGIGTWYREHLDHQLPHLLGARGPFCQCSEEAHREPHQPAADPAPPGWWEHGTPLAIAAARADAHQGDIAATAPIAEEQRHDDA